MRTFGEFLARAQERLRAEPELEDYWRGYLKGLRCGHYGEQPEEDASESRACANGLGDGYYDGLRAEVDGGVN